MSYFSIEITQMRHGHEARDVTRQICLFLGVGNFPSSSEIPIPVKWAACVPEMTDRLDTPF